MKFEIKNLLLISFCITLGLVIAHCVVAESASKQFNVYMQVLSESVCNSNGICEPDLGEDSTNCFNDCGCNHNLVCESQRLETAANCPSDCAAGGGGGGGTVPEFGLYIKNLKIDKITFGSAELSWQTSKPAQCTLYLGKTTEYEKETITETKFLADHVLEITNLYPSTAYHFNLVCKDAYSEKDQTGDRFFATLYIIGNVNNFTATARETDILLSWENPEDTNFDSVRIVKNENFYPADINDGTVIYKGASQTFTDGNVRIGKVYYYAAFAHGKNGSWSSGALAFAQIQPPVTPVAPVTPVTPITPVFPQEKYLKLSDFDFYSNGVKLPVINEKMVEPQANRELIVSINYEKIPANYKKLFFELNANQNKYLYLFTPNEEKTVYGVRLVSPLQEQGYPFRIVFLDEENKFVSELQGELSVWLVQTKTPLLWIWLWLKENIVMVFLIIILILLLILFLILEKRREKKEKALVNENNY